MYDVNSTDTHERTATNPTPVSNVVAHITTKIVISEGTCQQNVPCVTEITQQTTKAASIIIILSSKKTIHIETLTPPERSIPIPTSAYNHTTTPHSLPLQQQQQQQQQRRYADVASNHAQLAEEPITTLKAFLEDFEGLFAQLIQQNGMIVNMLTMILNKPH